MFILCIVLVVKFINHSWRKKNILHIIEADLGDIGLCHKNKFDKRESFFDHLRQNVQCGRVIHYGFMQYLHILYPNHVKVPKKSPFMNIKLTTKISKYFVFEGKMNYFY